MVPPGRWNRPRLIFLCRLLGRFLPCSGRFISLGACACMEPFKNEADGVCVTCPSLTLAKGAFDVAPSPGRGVRYSPEKGFNIDECGVPTCIHPEKVGLPPGRYIGGSAESMGDVTGPGRTRPPAGLPSWSG
jgi:hypothetical protein